MDAVISRSGFREISMGFDLPADCGTVFSNVIGYLYEIFPFFQ
jgi:hypothetical protein